MKIGILRKSTTVCTRARMLFSSYRISKISRKYCSQTKSVFHTENRTLAAIRCERSGYSNSITLKINSQRKKFYSIVFSFYILSYSFTRNRLLFDMLFGCTLYFQLACFHLVSISVAIVANIGLLSALININAFLLSL